MNRTVKTFFLSFLMIFLGLSAATSSLNESSEITVLEEDNDSQEVILSLNLLNEPGHQEGSIYTDTTLSTGTEQTCAILDNGSVSCWGRGGFGALGNGGTSNKSTPTLTSSLGAGRTAVAISTGGYHTCAILDNGSVSCWGAGSSGRLGNGGTSQKNTPTLTSSLGTGRTAVAISTGGYHTCVILDNGAVSCWGVGSQGRLGNGGSSQKNTPTLTSSLGTGRTAVALSSGTDHTCAILDNGAVSCWGYGINGQLGNGGTYYARFTPTLTSSLGAGRTAVALSSGTRHTCAILDNGAVSCWGMGSYGELGSTGTTDAVPAHLGYQKNTPTLTSSLGTGRTAVAISTGGYHTCAILDNGSVSCWGRGVSGQLGSPVTITTYFEGPEGGHATPTLTSSLGAGRTAALSERDLDNDGTLNVFESTSPSLVSCTAGQYGFYMCVEDRKSVV